MKRLLLLPLLPLMALASCSQPPETSSGDPRVDCARFKSTWAAEKRADDSKDYSFKKLRSIIIEIGQERAKETEEWDNFSDMVDDVAIEEVRKDSAVYAVTKHLGYSQQERTRMWDYRRSVGKLYLEYYELPEEEKEGDIWWLMDQGLPYKEAEEFCKALGINPRP